MGNKASYNQVPIGDMNSPSLNATNIAPPKTIDTAKAEEKIADSDLMFVFHDTEEDSAERVVHEQINNQRDIEEELKYSVTLNDRLICERLAHSETSDIHSLCSILQPGDLVEFCAEYNSHHWVVYVGNRFCVHLRDGKVMEEYITAIHSDRMARIVNAVFKFKALPSPQVCDAARSQIGKDSVWSNSECFAAWCRYGCPEFMSDNIEIKDLDTFKPDTPTDKCKIEVFDKLGKTSETKHFTNLVELIKYRRKRESDDAS